MTKDTSNTLKTTVPVVSDVSNNPDNLNTSQEHINAVNISDADELRRDIDHFHIMCLGILTCRNMGAYTQERYKKEIGQQTDILLSKIQTVMDRAKDTHNGKS